MHQDNAHHQKMHEVKNKKVLPIKLRTSPGVTYLTFVTTRFNDRSPQLS